MSIPHRRRRVLATFHAARDTRPAPPLPKAKAKAKAKAKTKAKARKAR